ncbi:MAG: DUF2769 domain-containing protein [Coriobacteriia bacterium]|nr:DUF2769 domain-containing protein [Coriobacteriia bacterium]
MRAVRFTDENIRECLCGQCPVQARSECADRMYRASGRAEGKVPSDPRSLPGLYCSIGLAVCDDLDFPRACECPRCLVWGRHGLAGNHYCALGKPGQAD